MTWLYELLTGKLAPWRGVSVCIFTDRRPTAQIGGVRAWWRQVVVSYRWQRRIFETERRTE